MGWRRVWGAVSVVVIGVAGLGTSAHGQLRSRIAQIAAQAQGKVGVACSLPGRRLECDFNADEALPMQSVFKLPVAMAVLQRVEQEKLTLGERVRVTPSKWALADEWSPLRDEHPRGTVTLTVDELLRRTMVASDDVTCDVLLAKIGGPAAADAYVRGLGIKGISIRDSEMGTDRDERRQYRNEAEPGSLVELLRLLADRSPLTPEHTRMLLGWMAASHTGDGRIAALLPRGTAVAGKTGTAGVHRSYMNATNDAALITMPDGKKLALVVLVTDAKAPLRVRERVIAEVAQAVWEAAR